MIQTETSKAKIIFVSVPNDYVYYQIYNNKLFTRSSTDALPQGNWTILNVLDDVTEDEAEMVVSNFAGCYPIWNGDTFRLVIKATARQSLHSLATSLGVEGKTIILYELK